MIFKVKKGKNRQIVELQQGQLVFLKICQLGYLRQETEINQSEMRGKIFCSGGSANPWCAAHGGTRAVFTCVSQWKYIAVHPRDSLDALEVH
jgi:hypothetical protein